MMHGKLRTARKNKDEKQKEEGFFKSIFSKLQK
jgi:hypothetical protein